MQVPDQSIRLSGGFMPHNVVLQIHLKDDSAPENRKYLACGPPIMTAAVIKMLIAFGLGRANVFLDDLGG
jgi:Na+-transporting NADH:ubiquinone oxidoreductase subunit F